MKKIFFGVVIVFFISCGSTSTTNNTTTTGTISGTLNLSDSNSSTNAFLRAVTAGSGVKVYVVGLGDDVYGETNSNGEFTIEDVPAGSHCIYSETSSSESSSRLIVSQCNIEVAESTDTSVGEIETSENENYTCETDSECQDTWSLPAYECDTSFASGSISSQCGGFLCNGTTDEGEKYCVYGSASTASSSSGCDGSTNNNFGILGSAPSGTDDFTYVRSSPGGTCEITTLCSDGTACPSGQTCFMDGYCISENIHDEESLGTCDPQVGCTASGDANVLCVPVQRGNNCEGQCYDEDVLISFETCETDSDCDEIGGGTCYETTITRTVGDEQSASSRKFCVKNDISVCE